MTRKISRKGAKAQRRKAAKRLKRPSGKVLLSFAPLRLCGKFSFA
jgi:hypothetical protein